MTIETHIADGKSLASEYLAHYGVKGMRWGVRKDRGGVVRAKVRTSHTPGQRVQATGGTGQKASPDAVRAKIAGQKARESTTDALSNKELKALIARMQMEQQYHQLRDKTATEKGKAFVAQLILGAGKAQASSVVNDRARVIADTLKTKKK